MLLGVLSLGHLNMNATGLVTMLYCHNRGKSLENTSESAANAPSCSHGSPVMPLGSAAVFQGAVSPSSSEAAIREMTACIAYRKEKTEGESRARSGGLTDYGDSHLPIRSVRVLLSMSGYPYTTEE